MCVGRNSLLLDYLNIDGKLGQMLGNLHSIPLIYLFEILTIFLAVPVDLIKGNAFSYKLFPAIDGLMIISCLLF